MQEQETKVVNAGVREIDLGGGVVLVLRESGSSWRQAIVYRSGRTLIGIVTQFRLDQSNWFSPSIVIQGARFSNGMECVDSVGPEAVEQYLEAVKLTIEIARSIDHYFSTY